MLVRETSYCQLYIDNSLGCTKPAVGKLVLQLLNCNNNGFLFLSTAQICTSYVSMSRSHDVSASAEFTVNSALMLVDSGFKKRRKSIQFCFLRMSAFRTSHIIHQNPLTKLNTGCTCGNRGNVYLFKCSQTLHVIHPPTHPKVDTSCYLWHCIEGASQRTPGRVKCSNQVTMWDQP